MGLRINTNVSSLTSQRHLSNSLLEQRRSMTKLASGERIVSAGDDAAGMAISEKLKGEVRGSQQAERNSNDGISLVQTAEGGLNEISNILIRLKELSVQAASDTIGDKERSFSNLEYQSLLQEINRISYSTEFNGTKLLQGDGEVLDFQVGTRNSPELDRLSFDLGATKSTTDQMGLESTSVESKEDAQNNLGQIDEALSVINGSRASLGALQNRLISTVKNLQIKAENLSDANSRIRDADVAVETSNLTRSNVLSAAGTSVLAQANNSPMTALKLLS